MPLTDVQERLSPQRRPRGRRGRAHALGAARVYSLGFLSPIARKRGVETQSGASNFKGLGVVPGWHGSRLVFAAIMEA